MWKGAVFHDDILSRLALLRGTILNINVVCLWMMWGSPSPQNINPTPLYWKHRYMDHPTKFVAHTTGPLYKPTKAWNLKSSRRRRHRRENKQKPRRNILDNRVMKFTQILLLLWSSRHVCSLHTPGISLRVLRGPLLLCGPGFWISDTCRLVDRDLCLRVEEKEAAY